MKLMNERGSLWINHYELNRDEFCKIKAVLFGKAKVFDALSIDTETVPSVRQFEWNIAGDSYQQLKYLPVSGHIVSPQFTYNVVTDSKSHLIKFHSRFYGQYSERDPQCAIFLEIDDMPDSVKRLRIEVDMKCDKNNRFRQLLRTRVLSKDQRITGFITFHNREIGQNTRMDWIFAVKMFDAEMEIVDEDEEYLRDLYQIFA